MKKLTIFVCAVALLLAFTNIATATEPTEQSFEISVRDVEPFPPPFVPLNECLYKFSMVAEGTVHPVDDSPYFEGTFNYNEKGVINLCTGHGTNQAVMTVSDNNSGDTVTIRWQGQTNDFQWNSSFLVGTVSGNFVVLEATGVYEHLHGQGSYESSERFNLFDVTFTGRFHCDP